MAFASMSIDASRFPRKFTISNLSLCIWAVCFIVSKYRRTNVKRFGTGKNIVWQGLHLAGGTFWGGILGVGSKLGMDTRRVESHRCQCKSLYSK